MSLFINTTYRSDLVELMDDLNMRGDLLRDTLNKIAAINKFLGGNSVTLSGLKSLLKRLDKSDDITIVDLGCGNGDMLRELANYGAKSGYKFKLIGVDANQFTINYAKELSKNYKEIEYHKLDVFSDNFNELEYDIVLAALFVHHFKEDQIINLVSKILTKARIGLIVNDLHRHKIAYYLFKMISFFIGNSMVQHDGLLSILRGFKRNELESMARKLNCKSSIRWKWAFRYQWIIQR